MRPRKTTAVLRACIPPRVRPSARRAALRRNPLVTPRPLSPFRPNQSGAGKNHPRRRLDTAAADRVLGDAYQGMVFFFYLPIVSERRQRREKQNSQIPTQINRERPKRVCNKGQRWNSGPLVCRRRAMTEAEKHL
ncbi:hypothetical protein EVAR_100295_1 [Eumeta japonica]|uniref:Uncharacterized protein n=1 Tax=Eumeta variegata TaxID=151549 RepID=A0A4C2A9X0_EUMVA|nr:hypothetical protein EVAR_100295_1 [Eumeta japonica]